MTSERGESMEKYHVILEQGDNVIRFAFNRLCDAQEFMNTCIETVDTGTKVIFYEDE